MAILFEWYENPVAPSQTQEETKLHARITLNGTADTARLRRKIQERCSLTETDVSAVLDALSHAMGDELAEGKQVHLDGIVEMMNRKEVLCFQASIHYNL